MSLDSFASLKFRLFSFIDKNFGVQKQFDVSFLMEYFLNILKINSTIKETGFQDG